MCKIHQPEQTCQLCTPQQNVTKKALTYIDYPINLYASGVLFFQAVSKRAKLEAPNHQAGSSFLSNHPRKGVQLKNLVFSAAAPTYMMPHGVPSAGDWALDRYSAVFLQGTQKTLIDGCTWTRKFTSKLWHIN